MKKAWHNSGTILVVSMLLWFLPEGAGGNNDTGKDLRPAHIDVAGDQDVFEKAFEPGTKGADSLSHPRRSTVFIGSAEFPTQDLGIGFHQTEHIRFTTRASAFLYAYPTPKSKRTMDVREEGQSTGKDTNEYGVWIVTCKHVVKNHPFIGVRLNTTTGSSLTYVSTGASWRRDDKADVAVLRFKGWRNPDIDLAMFEYDQAIEKDDIVANVLYEGTPVALTGYPISMLTTPDRNFPVVQFGYIAQIQGYLEGDKNHPVFLIGGAVFPGNSGGPVLIPGGTPRAVTRYFRRGLLLGMVCAQRQAPTRTRTEWTFKISQSAYLAQVVPMARIHRAIEQSGEWNVSSR